MKIFSITWKDAVGEDTGWTDLENVLKEELCPVHTVGQLIAEKDDCYILGMSYEPQNEKVGAYITIPKVLVIKIKEIK